MSLKAILSLLLFTAAANAGSQNKNSNCKVVDMDGVSGKDLYYDPAGQDDFGINVQSTDCDKDSMAQVYLTSPAGDKVKCSSLALDGGKHLVNCDNVRRGTCQGGKWKFSFDLGAPGHAQMGFGVTHTQKTTSTTPTSTVTYTSTDIVTVTTATTNTITNTYPQTTVTMPSKSVTNTVTVTPQPTTVTITKTKTYMVTRKKVHGTVVTSATTTCSTPPSLTAYPAKQPAARSRVMVRVAAPILRRNYANQGEGCKPDGPLATTYTASATCATTTSTIKTTITVTTTASDSTTTVPCSPATKTEYTGAACTSTTTTLPQSTKTKTRYTHAVTKTTTTATTTFTCTPTVYSCK